MSINYLQSLNVWEKLDNKHSVIIPMERIQAVQEAIGVVQDKMKTIQKTSEEYQTCWTVYLLYRLELAQLKNKGGVYVTSL